MRREKSHAGLLEVCPFIHDRRHRRTRPPLQRDRRLPIFDKIAAAQAESLEANCKEFAIPVSASPAAPCASPLNGGQLSPGHYSVSTSNRNFEGRLGKGGRTLLASPLTAAGAVTA